MKSSPVVRAMCFLAPDGTKILTPMLEELEPIIFRGRTAYWRSGSGSASFAVVEHRGPKQIAILADEPCLMFFLVERHGFLFIYFQPKPVGGPTQFVPFAGGDCRPWVRHTIGGDVFFAPRACFVSRPFAWEVVKEFLRSKSPSGAVPWVERASLTFPSPISGDAPPRKQDIA